MSSIEEFKDWTDAIETEVNHVSKILSAKMSDTPEGLISDVEDAEAWYARVGYLLSEADSWVEKGSFFYLPDREDKTEMDRKIELAKNLSPIRQMRDYLKILLKAIEQRVSLGQSILRHHAQLRDVRVYKNEK